MLFSWREIQACDGVSVNARGYREGEGRIGFKFKRKFIFKCSRDARAGPKEGRGLDSGC
jgi:hypothetical protein